MNCLISTNRAILQDYFVRVFLIICVRKCCG